MLQMPPEYGTLPAEGLRAEFAAPFGSESNRVNMHFTPGPGCGNMRAG